MHTDDAVTRLDQAKCYKSDDGLDASENDHRCHILTLPDEVFRYCLAFVGPFNYRYVAGVCKTFRFVYNPMGNYRNLTLAKSVASSISCAELFWKERRMKDKESIKKWLVPMMQQDLKMVADAAAVMGHRNIIDWAVDRGLKFSDAVCVKAAQNGHYDLMKWAAKQTRAEFPVAFATSVFAFEGKQDLLEWAIQSGGDVGSLTCELAVAGGQIAVLKWLRESLPTYLNEGDSFDWNWFRLWRAAGEVGRVDILEWLRSNASETGMKEAVFTAAENGHINVLEWARGKGFSDTSNSRYCEVAAFRGQLEALKWLRAHRYVMDGNVIVAAKMSHDVEVIQWARKNHPPSK